MSANWTCALLSRQTLPNKRSWRLCSWGCQRWTFNLLTFHLMTSVLSTATLLEMAATHLKIVSMYREHHVHHTCMHTSWFDWVKQLILETSIRCERNSSCSNAPRGHVMRPSCLQSAVVNTETKRNFEQASSQKVLKKSISTSSQPRYGQQNPLILSYFTKINLLTSPNLWLRTWMTCFKWFAETDLANSPDEGCFCFRNHTFRKSPKLRQLHLAVLGTACG